jgi:poly-beta-1,6-N-acetyl-D-glucosamine synthase
MSVLVFINYLIVIFGVINLFRMAMFLIGADIYGLKFAWKKRKWRHSHYQPPVTVVIPAHNEANTVLRAIESVVFNDYPQHKLEVVVVDDGSTDSTVALIEKFKSEHPEFPINLISQANAGKAQALNHGMRASQFGELVMCLDADSALSKNAIKKAVFHFCDPNVAALSANVRITRRSGWLNLIQYYEYILCYQMKRAESLFNFEYIVGGIGSMFRREVLEKVGYYDTDTVTEDIDLTMKILKLGNKKHKVEYGSDVVVYTESVLDLAGLVRQRYRWKWGRSQTFVKNAKLFFSVDKKYTKSLTWFYLPFAIYGDISYFLEPLLFFYILGISVYFMNFMPLLYAGLIMAAYISLNVLAEDSIDWKQKLRLVWFSPTMYLCFYILSFVEYWALLKTFVGLPKLPKSIVENHCGWVHVERPQVVSQDFLLARE